MRFATLIIVPMLAACAVSSGAADAPPPFTPAASAAHAEAPGDYPVAIDLPAGAYRLDPRHASVVFRIRHEGLAWFTARFDSKDATLSLVPNDPAQSQLAASVDAASVNTGVLDREGARAFDQQIAAALGGGQIAFVSTAIVRTGEHAARITGDLTLNGQTRPAVLEATFAGAALDPLRGGRTVLGFSAHGQIDRSDWGLSDWRAFTGDEVQIVIEAEFVKA
jgi:polyisoprenoid-binding protein YceI